MRTLLRVEEAFLVLLSIWLFARLDLAWWWYPALFLGPDVSMVGYVLGPRVGAATYNLAHHRGVAVGTLLAGSLAALPLVTAVGTVLLGHGAADRILGFGLKHPEGFAHTHLGSIGGSRDGT